MACFLAVANRKGGVGKSTTSVMLAHAAAAWSGHRVLVIDLDTQCNASLMLVGGEGWDKARRSRRTIADYLFDRFDKVAEDESQYVIANAGDVAHPRTGNGRVALLPGSLLMEDIQGELFVAQARKGKDTEVVATEVRGRLKRLMKHFGMDYDVVILDCPPGLSFAALAALDLANRVVVPFRPDFVSQFAIDRISTMIEKVHTSEDVAAIPFAERRYVCLPNYVRNNNGRERLLLDQMALDHPMLASRIPLLDSVARAFDWEETKKSMVEKYADALPHLRALHAEVFSGIPRELD
ncbi:MAG: ParA family protein [Hyphomicrobiaceae bacterium]|nr:ParA family protein [Hyphomicrobiaceae bacterium]